MGLGGADRKSPRDPTEQDAEPNIRILKRLTQEDAGCVSLSLCTGPVRVSLVITLGGGGL